MTGYSLSARRAERDEFASLLPTDGVPHLKVQTVVKPSPASSPTH